MTYPGKEENKRPHSSDLVQDTLQALCFRGQQSPQSAGLQGEALYLFGAEWPLGNHSLGLALQSDYGLIDRVSSGIAGGENNCQALLQRNNQNISFLGASLSL